MYISIGSCGLAEAECPQLQLKLHLSVKPESVSHGGPKKQGKVSSLFEL